MNNKFEEIYHTSLAINMLTRLGNAKPTQEQIDLVETLLKKVAVIQHLSFSQKLTDREAECLYLAATGKTSAQTGKMLNIQAVTVEQHRKELKKKLFSKSMSEAVFKGIQLGYVTQNK